jgi:hypothetical protein
MEDLDLRPTSYLYINIITMAEIFLVLKDIMASATDWNSLC